MADLLTEKARRHPGAPETLRAPRLLFLDSDAFISEHHLSVDALLLQLHAEQQDLVATDERPVPGGPSFYGQVTPPSPPRTPAARRPSPPLRASLCTAPSLYTAAGQLGRAFRAALAVGRRVLLEVDARL